jgi:simple sugar transport system ATP-binding protein
MLVPAFTVAENLALNSLDRSPLLDVHATSKHACDIAGELGWEIDPNAVTQTLSVGAMQRVEIIKALASDGKVLLLDEPTATLAPHEVEDLFRVMRALRAQEKAIVLITHKLDEALSIADRVTVLRRGKVVVTVPAVGISPGQLATWMVGDVPAPVKKSDVTVGDPRVVIQELSIFGDRGEKRVDNVSFAIHSGEIVGFAGVAGNGQVELAEALAGVANAQTAIESAYIPEDRQRDGLALPMSIAENLLIEGHRKRELSLLGILLPPKVVAWCEKIVAKFGIKTDNLTLPASSLSGGNQQKIVVGRILDAEPEFIVAVNPTRGLDVQAETFFHSQLIAAKSRGAAIALFSTDLDEILKLADKTYVMSGGKLLQGDNIAELMGGKE